MRRQRHIVLAVLAVLAAFLPLPAGCAPSQEGPPTTADELVARAGRAYSEAPCFRSNPVMAARSVNGGQPLGTASMAIESDRLGKRMRWKSPFGEVTVVGTSVQIREAATLDRPLDVETPYDVVGTLEAIFNSKSHVPAELRLQAGHDPRTVLSALTAGTVGVVESVQLIESPPIGTFQLIIDGVGGQAVITFDAETLALQSMVSTSQIQTDGDAELSPIETRIEFNTTFTEQVKPPIAIERRGDDQPGAIPPWLRGRLVDGE